MEPASTDNDSMYWNLPVETIVVVEPANRDNHMDGTASRENHNSEYDHRDGTCQLGHRGGTCQQRQYKVKPARIDNQRDGTCQQRNSQVVEPASRHNSCGGNCL